MPRLLVALAVLGVVVVIYSQSPMGRETISALMASAPAGPACHPSYEGACVPRVSDVDCLGLGQNGPAFVGRVRVVGPDVYELDRDGDGIGC